MAGSEVVTQLNPAEQRVAGTPAVSSRNRVNFEDTSNKASAFFDYALTTNRQQLPRFLLDLFVTGSTFAKAV